MAGTETPLLPAYFDWKDCGWRAVSPVNPGVDVRVREPLLPSEPSDLWLGAASLEDIVGASLVTYDEHLGPLQVDPVVPKAVYLRYDTLDPVTQAVAPVVVPAQLTLDAYADPSMFWQPFEEEPEEEEEQPDEEMEDRRKLRSSIKGDPILLRAKPAPPPEPYAAPYRYEKVCTEALLSQSAPSSPETSRRARQVPPLQLVTGSANGPQAVIATAGLGEAGAKSAEAAGEFAEGDQGERSALATPRRPATGTRLERAYGGRQKPVLEEEEHGERRFFSRCVEATATMSSFLKASGRDKYGLSRLRELDRILTSRRAPAAGLAAGRLPPDPSPGPGRAGGACREGHSGAVLREELEACLATHIQRIPRFHQGRLASAEGASSTSQEDASPELGDASAVGGAPGEEADATGPGPSLRKKTPRPVSPADGASCSSQPISGLHDALLAVAPGKPEKPAVPLGLRRTRRDVGGRTPGEVPCPAVKLRDLDPHLGGVSNTAPTQHLHSNWPDGLKRKVARHFYGMTHAQILMEEHRERMRDHGRRNGAKESGAEYASEGNANGPKLAGEQSQPLSPRKRPQAQAASARSAREAMAPGGPANIAHGLEIRIPNSYQPSVRVVVSRHTERVRRTEESVARPTVLLDKLTAETKMLSRKY